MTLSRALLVTGMGLLGMLTGCSKESPRNAVSGKII